MPHVIAELNGFNLYSWVFTIYMLTSTTAVPIFGKLADLFGRRLVSDRDGALPDRLRALRLVARHDAIDRLPRDSRDRGGALMPIAMTIIGDIFPPDRRQDAGHLRRRVRLISVLGPAVGGFIVDHLAWQWIFYINLPFGIFAAIILSVSLKESKSTKKNRSTGAEPPHLPARSSRSSSPSRWAAAAARPKAA